MDNRMRSEIFGAWFGAAGCILRNNQSDGHLAQVISNNAVINYPVTSLYNVYHRDLIIPVRQKYKPVINILERLIAEFPVDDFTDHPVDLIFWHALTRAEKFIRENFFFTSRETIYIRSVTLGSHMAAVRNLWCMSQEDIAEKIGVKQKDISSWECDSRVPNAANLYAYCNAVMYPVDNMMPLLNRPKNKIVRKNSGEVIIKNMHTGASHTLVPKKEADKKISSITDTPGPGYVTMTEYAKMHGITVSGASRRISQGKINGVITVGNKKYIPINPEDVSNDKTDANED